MPVLASLTRAELMAILYFAEFAVFEGFVAGSSECERIKPSTHSHQDIIYNAGVFGGSGCAFRNSMGT